MKTLTQNRRFAGFTLFEVLIGVAALVLLGGVAFQILRGGLINFARNQSLNMSAEKSRVIMDKLVRETEQAIDVPELVTVGTISGSPALQVAGTTTSMAIRFTQMKAGLYLVSGPVGSTVGTGATTLSYTSNSATQIQLDYVPGSSANGAQAPVVGDRLIVLSPNDLGETVTAGTSPGKKHGRRITVVTTPTTLANGNKRVTVTLSTSVGRPVLCNNPAFVGREVAFVARDVNGRREMHYLPSTDSLAFTGSTLLSQDLDPTPLAAPFKITTLSANDKRLDVRLPIKAADYSATLQRVNPTNEFNAYLLTFTQIPIRNRNFVPTLTQLP